MIAWALRACTAIGALLIVTGGTTMARAQTATREALYPQAASARFEQFKRFGQPGPYYPAAAAQRGVGGEALVQCKVSQTHALSECQTIEESPDGFGFADAVRAMAKRGWMVAAPKGGGQAESPDEIGRFLVVFRVDSPRP